MPMQKKASPRRSSAGRSRAARRCRTSGSAGRSAGRRSSAPTPARRAPAVPRPARSGGRRPCRRRRTAAASVMPTQPRAASARLKSASKPIHERASRSVGRPASASSRKARTAGRRASAACGSLLSVSASIMVMGWLEMKRRLHSPIPDCQDLRRRNVRFCAGPPGAGAHRIERLQDPECHATFAFPSSQTIRAAAMDHRRSSTWAGEFNVLHKDIQTALLDERAFLNESLAQGNGVGILHFSRRSDIQNSRRL